MKKLITTLALATGLALPAASQASIWYGNVFKSPTGNLVCKYRGSSDTITCGRWNDQRIVSMTAYGPAREGTNMNWTGEKVHTLYYGQKYRGAASRITCFSGFNGMRCTNFQGHGFFISRTVFNMW